MYKRQAAPCAQRGRTCGHGFGEPAQDPGRASREQVVGGDLVQLAPGSAFGYEDYLRLGLGQEPALFAEGLARTASCFVDLRAAS